MDAVRACRRGRAGLQFHPASRMAPDRARRRHCSRVGARRVARPRRAPRPGAAGGSPVRMVAGWAVAPDQGRRPLRNRVAHWGHRHAWPLDPAGLDRRDGALAPAQPPLRINRSGGGQPGGFPDAQRASLHPSGPAFRTQRGRGPLTTDRLVTPFHASRAQSGPRKVSPMNFTGGSRSIQRLLAARPLLTCWSRGRA